MIPIIFKKNRVYITDPFIKREVINKKIEIAKEKINNLIYFVTKKIKK